MPFDETLELLLIRLNESFGDGAVDEEVLDVLLGEFDLAVDLRKAV